MTAGETDSEARLVVCAVDGSNADGNAVEVATQLAVLGGARLALIAVASTRTGENGSWTLEEALNALELTAKTLESRVAVDCYVDAGNPVRRLVDFAALTGALLLVVGTKASAADRPPSIVAGRLARAAPCPVVMVPETGRVPALAGASGV